MKDHRGHGTVMNGFLDGFLPEVGSYAARSVLHRLEDILNSEGLNKYEQEVMKYVFRPDDGEKLAGKFSLWHESRFILSRNTDTVRP